VGLERGAFSLVSTIEELFERKSSGSGLESREYGRRDVTLTTWHPLSAKVGTLVTNRAHLFTTRFPLLLRRLMSWIHQARTREIRARPRPPRA
jgi:hypothetical protein